MHVFTSSHSAITRKCLQSYCRNSSTCEERLDNTMSISFHILETFLIERVSSTSLSRLLNLSWSSSGLSNYSLLERTFPTCSLALLQEFPGLLISIVFRYTFLAEEDGLSHIPCICWCGCLYCYSIHPADFYYE